MPTYEYVCKACGHRFEIWQSMSDDPLTICQECGGELRKVFAPPAITFKGSGFYATDHGKKAKTGEGATPKKEAASTSSKGTDGSGSGSGGSGSGGSGSGGSGSGSGTGGSGGSSGSKDAGSSGSKTDASTKGSSS